MTDKLTLPGLIVLLFTGRVVAQAPPADPKKTLLNDPLVKNVSMVQLIATPDVYQGQLVKVAGYLVRQYEHSALYLHQEDYAHTLKKNGLWASFSPEVASGKRITTYLRPYTGKYVAVIGTFDKAKGHLGMFSGTIQAITYIDTIGHRN